MALPVRGIALPLLAALALVWGPAAAAQIPSSFPPAASFPVPSVRAQPEGLALEGAVDAETYRVGPGDVFAVSIGGGRDARQSTVAVSADGLLAVPEAGTFRAADRTLAAVRREVGAALQARYRGVPTDVVLASPREFYVHVGGSVPAPGRYVVGALARVEDALGAALPDGASPRSLAAYDQPARRRVERRPALRNVRVTGRDGREARVDLLRYFATGDPAFNPTLLDGDAVRLPTFDPDREGIAVSGAVDRPGTYDARPGDTAADLLAVTAGVDLEGRIAAVRRTRPGATGAAQSLEVPVAQAATLDLLPRDQLFAVPSAPDAGLATVIGEVRFPGTYPIVAGRTTLDALVEMAGGLSDEALARAAYLERSVRSEPDEDVADRRIGFASAVSQDDLDPMATDLGALSGFSLVGRRFYTQEALRTPRVAVDVPGALAGRAAVALEDGDRLVVPRDLGAVRVFGQVAGAGYVPFVEGRTAGDYVEAAGGRAPSATEVYVVEAGTGRFVAGTDTPVESGDAVFVDRTPTANAPAVEQLALSTRQIELEERQIELQDLRDRRASRTQLIQTVFAAITTIATVILTYDALTSSSSSAP